ncbi:MAG: hypothetical protein AAFR59_15625 [Bacteroidota bacterium]
MRISLQMLISFVLLMGLLVFIQIPDAQVAAERWQSVPFLRTNTAQIDSAIANMSLAEKLSHLVVVRVKPTDLDREIFREVIENYALGGYLLQGFELDSAQKTIAFLRQQKSSHPLVGFQHAPVPTSIWPIPSGVALGHIEDEATLSAVAQHGIEAFSTLNAHFWVQDVPSDWMGKENYKLFAENYAQLTSELQSDAHLLALQTHDIYYPHKRDSIRRENRLQPFRRVVKEGLSTMIFPVTELQTDRPILQESAHLRPYLKRQLKFEGLVMLSCPDSLKQTDVWLERFTSSGADLWIASADQVPGIIRGLQQMQQIGKWDLTALDNQVRRIMMAQRWSEQSIENTQDSTVWAEVPHNIC